MDYEKLFEEKSGYTLDELDGEDIYRYNTPHGFFAVRFLEKGVMFVVALSGDGKLLVPWIESEAVKLGYKKIRFLTKRNPKVWKRKYGYDVAEYVMEKEL